ncbi:MAG: ABC transporter permease [Clostridia bacterium]|nr:ABC transporter permease [Clostridia bacterium]
MKAIYNRELSAYFTSPIGYVFVGVFMLLSGLFFGYYMFQLMLGDVTLILPMCLIILILLAPILTMRLLAEERSSKTDQLLLTAPINVSSIVLGKYFAAYTVFLIACATTLPYLIVAAICGDVAWGEVIASYVGFLFIGALIVAIGIFVSSLTESQIVAAVVTYGLLLALFFSSMISIGIDLFDEILRYLNISIWSDDFFRGIFSPSGIIYYTAFTALCLFLTMRKIESRRWK